MQIQDILDAPQLRVRPVFLTGDAVRRQVNWTFTTDLIDPRRYLSRGQLVLTGLVWRTAPEDSEIFVSHVVAAGASALLAGEGLLGHIPADVIAACRRHGLPLFAVPADVSFASITAFVSNTLAGDRIIRLAAGLVRQRELLMEVYQGQMLDELIGRVATELGRAIWVTTGSGRLIVESTVDLDEADLRTITHAAFTTDHVPVSVVDSQGEHVSVFRVLTAGEHVAGAWLLIVAGDWTGWDPTILDAVRELAGVTGLYRVQYRAREIEWTDVTTRLIELISSDSENPETAVYRRQAGLDDDTEVVVVAATFEGEPELRDLALTVVSDAAAHVSRPIVAPDGDDRVVAILPVDGSAAGSSAEETFSRALSRLAPAFADAGVLRVGASPSVPVTQMGGALRAARYALQLSSGADEGHPVQFRDSASIISSVQLLSTVPDPLRRAFVDLLLGRLAAHDARHQTQLIPTLHAFLECDGSWVRTAEVLHLHLNSVRYRIARVEEITGRDLSTTADRADFHLALRLI